MKTVKLLLNTIVILTLLLSIGCKKPKPSKEESFTPLTWANLDGEYRSQNIVEVIRSPTPLGTPGKDTTYVLNDVINTVYSDGTYKNIEIQGPFGPVWATFYPDGKVETGHWMSGAEYRLYRDTLFFKGSYGSPKFFDMYSIKGVKVKK